MGSIRKIGVCSFCGGLLIKIKEAVAVPPQSPAATKPSPSGGLMGRRCRWQIQAAREQRSGRANASGRKDAPREPGTASREVDCPIGQAG